MTPHIERKKPKIIQNENEEDIAVEDKKNTIGKSSLFKLAKPSLQYMMITVYSLYVLA